MSGYATIFYYEVHDEQSSLNPYLIFNGRGCEPLNDKSPRPKAPLRYWWMIPERVLVLHP